MDNDEKRIVVEENWQPDVVVGIDVGMTCTAVSYSMGPNWADPKPIQKWPGKLSLDICNKVPTAIEYDEKTGQVVGWGFKVGSTNLITRIEEFFKLNLDPNFGDNEAVQCQEAHRWLTDYLDCLYAAVSAYFQDRFARSGDLRYEYLFSTPTTWSSPAVIGKVEDSIKRSAFGKRPYSRIRMSLTEAEAAAVYASKQKFKAGDVVIMCDAGGGTTDLNVLKIQDVSHARTLLKPLVWVEGTSIGSTIIDFKAEHLVVSRLRMIQHLLAQSPEDCAKEMMKGRFERFKCSFGSFAVDQPVLRLLIPDLSQSINAPEASIEDSHLLISREELAAIFNEQIDQMDKLIESQIQQFKRRNPAEDVSYLILSGGLGSSEYVRTQLRRLCETKYATYANPYAPRIQVLVADEPQLAVAQGLVMNRTQELSIGTSIFPYRCARNSYGVLTRERYNPHHHTPEDVTADPRDGKKWAEGRIHWLITKGQLVSVDKGLEQPYALKLDLSQARQPWGTQIVMSELPANELPTSMRMPGVRVLCKIESMLSDSLLERRNDKWWNMKREHFQASLVLKILVGAADLKFQIWTRDRTRCSKDHDQIKVEWDQTKEKPAMSPMQHNTVYPEKLTDDRRTLPSH